MYLDIALSLNRTLQTPLLVVINSILRNTTLSNDQGLAPLRFNIVVPPGETAFFTRLLHQTFEADYHNVIFRTQEFIPPAFLKQYLDNKFQENVKERRLSRYMQYARLLLKDIFPDLERVIYFDADVVVLADVRSLFAEGHQLSESHYLAAVPHCFPAFLYFSNPFKVWADLRQFQSTFNSGVLLMDLRHWGEQTLALLKHYLALDATHHYRLFHLGDETIFNLMFKRSYLPLAKQWNCCGYGQMHWLSALLRQPISKMSVIHWSGGHHKPWESDRVIYADIWRRYLPSGRLTSASSQPPKAMVAQEFS